MKLSKLVFLLLTAILCLSFICGCERSSPIKNPGKVTLGLYDFTSTGLEGRVPTIVSSRELDAESSEALCRAINSVKEWEKYTCEPLMGFVGEFTVEGSPRVFRFTEDGGILCDDNLCGRLDTSGTKIIETIIKGS